jgi:hypothetical protein
MMRQNLMDVGELYSAYAHEVPAGACGWMNLGFFCAARDGAKIIDDRLLPVPPPDT